MSESGGRGVGEALLRPYRHSDQAEALAEGRSVVVDNTNPGPGE